jgi:hypothetical protein
MGHAAPGEPPPVWAVVALAGVVAVAAGLLVVTGAAMAVG